MEGVVLVTVEPPLARATGQSGNRNGKRLAQRSNKSVAAAAAAAMTAVAAAAAEAVLLGHGGPLLAGGYAQQHHRGGGQISGSPRSHLLHYTCANK